MLNFKPLLVTIVIFASIDLIFTMIGVELATAEEAFGVLRPTNTIPLKLMMLMFLGLILGGASIIWRRGLNLELVLTGVILIPLLDIDHLPIVLGIAQPVRPSHSLLFIALVTIALLLLLRRIDIPLMAVSSIVMHLAADGGSFPLLSPISLELYKFGIFEVIVLVAIAVSAGVLSGYSAGKNASQVGRRTARSLGV